MAKKFGMPSLGGRRIAGRRGELQGQVVRRQDREIVIEITVNTLLAWDPSGVRVVWADLTHCRAEIDATRSTRPGTVKGGTVIRLALRLDETALPGPPARILLVSHSQFFDIAIEP